MFSGLVSCGGRKLPVFGWHLWWWLSTVLLLLLLAAPAHILTITYLNPKCILPQSFISDKKVSVWWSLSQIWKSQNRGKSKDFTTRRSEKTVVLKWNVKSRNRFYCVRQNQPVNTIENTCWSCTNLHYAHPAKDSLPNVKPVIRRKKVAID